MTRADIVDEVARKTGVTKKDADDIIKAFLAEVTDALAKGEKVSLAGFGNFDIKETSDRQGRNPATGATITIKGKKKVRFKSAKALSDAVI